MEDDHRTCLRHKVCICSLLALACFAALVVLHLQQASAYLLCIHDHLTSVLDPVFTSTADCYRYVVKHSLRSGADLDADIREMQVGLPDSLFPFHYSDSGF